ncbi:DNA damage response protein RcaA [Venturia nashicola]|uniref:DNA damage response protein RcaA n=1 Tax=Venturia nashicola TaxID=86259 RepID=A0A4Z1P4Z0_9PEZI|nr:DNA damage response protein RcaA [Venturia nashicola]
MWILSCDGHLFENKKKWLKPGISHILGRTKKHEEGDPKSFIAINDKKVSRKHLKITVAPVKTGDGSSLFTRSEITIQDYAKHGTTIDGKEKITKAAKVLKGNEHTIQLGTYPVLLRLKWQPVVFSIHALSKPEKESHDPLSNYRQRLEQLDIKIIQEVVPGQTTHVVAEKRNVPPVLEALVLGLYVVSPNYVDAVVAAATSPPEEEGVEAAIAEGEEAPNYPPKSIEDDFDAKWPDPIEYVPPSSKEPVPRPAHFFAPDERRTHMFSGYTFVFYSAAQHESLQKAVTCASGKALRYEQFQDGKTTAKEVVAYLNTVAENKGLQDARSDRGGKGLVVVRPKLTKKTEALERLSHEVDRQLGRRSFEQSEFLDTITMNDLSGLRKALAEEFEMTSNAAQSSQPAPPTESRSARGESVPQETPKIEAPSSIRRRGHRQITQSRFKGFDDFETPQFPVTQTIPEVDEDEPMADATEREPVQAPSVRSTPQPQINSRKRATTPAEDEDDMLDRLLPGQAARKRRRLGRDGSAQPEDKSAAIPAPKVVRKPKKEPKIDVLEVAKSRREAEEEAARRDAESLKEAMEGIDIQGPANLVDCEEMEIKPRSKPPQTRTGVGHRDEGDRWDEKWNGRKNFKKFRKRGELPAMRGHRLLVPLEEAKKKDFGIGEEYWLESNSKQKKKSIRESQATRTQSQTVRDDDSEDESQFRRRRKTKQKTQETEPDTAEVVEESFLPATASLEASRGSNPTQESRVSETQLQKGKKRLGGELAKEVQPPAKKTGRAPRKVKDDSSDESEDELKFRSRRKRG